MYLVCAYIYCVQKILAIGCTLMHVHAHMHIHTLVLLVILYGLVYYPSLCCFNLGNNAHRAPNIIIDRNWSQKLPKSMASRL